MGFYVFDDFKKDSFQAKENPNAQYISSWCDAFELNRLNGDGEKCPVCGRPVSMLKWLEPRIIRLTNTKYPDRLTSWLSDPMVISEEVKLAYTQEGLIGINAFIPVEIAKVAHKKENSLLPPKYYCADINYTLNVRIDVEKSEIIGQKYDWSCELCNPWGTTIDRIIKISLDTSSWKGEDVFKVYSVGVVVSQKFYNFVQKHGFTNFNLVPITEYSQK